MGKKSNSLPEKTSRKNNLLSWLGKLFLFGSGVFIFFSLGIYFLSWDNLFVKKISQLIPYPVVTIENKNWISLNEFNRKSDQLRRYYEVQQVILGTESYDLGTEEGKNYFGIIKKNLLERMIKYKVAEVMGERYEVVVTSEEIAEEMSKIAEGDEAMAEFQKYLSGIYQINIAEYKKEVIGTQLYLKKLKDYYFQNLNKKEKAEEISSADFEKWYLDELSKMKIYIPLNRYFWHKEEGKVYFNNEKLNNYEREIFKK